MGKRKAIFAPKTRTMLAAVCKTPRLPDPLGAMQIQDVADEALEALDAGDGDTAMLCAALIGHMMEIAKWLNLLEGHTAFSLHTELLRKAKQREKADTQKTEKQKRVNLAHVLLAEYAPADVKKRRNAVRKEIGEIMQQRLELPEPIKPETVRSYLKQKKKR